jgi:hypothetical protein
MLRTVLRAVPLFAVVALAAACSPSPMTCASYSYAGTYAVTFDAPHAPNGPCPNAAPATWSVHADSVTVGALIPKGATLIDPPMLNVCSLTASWHTPPSTVEPNCAGKFVAAGYLYGDFNANGGTGVLTLASTCGDAGEKAQCIYGYTAVRTSW